MDNDEDTDFYHFSVGFPTFQLWSTTRIPISDNTSHLSASHCIATNAHNFTAHTNNCACIDSIPYCHP